MVNVVVRSERQATRAERLEKLHVALMMIGSGLLEVRKCEGAKVRELGEGLTQRREDAKVRVRE